MGKMMYTAAVAVAASLLPATTLADNWAVLVCGSKGYFNYRHQADTCHAFKTLRSRGIPEDHIITMMYDDVANSPNNPFPGKLFNKPTDGANDGIDVYEGCKIDYTGEDVTPAHFLDVLTGNREAMKGIGSERVLDSTKDDQVFVYFVDHGAVGLVAFPGDELYARDLVAALEDMHAANKYQELVFYLEACESGSMFKGLPAHLNIFATTAANATESSWGAYCPPLDKVNGHHLNTCLGDVYSVNWLQDADIAGNKETLQDQFLKVKQETEHNSHVLEFGETKMRSDRVGKFIGYRENSHSEETALRGKTAYLDLSYNKLSKSSNAANTKHASAVNSRDIDLVSQFYTYLRSPSPESAKLLILEIEHREQTTSLFKNIAANLILDTEELNKVMTTVPEDATKWDCHKAVTASFKKECATQWSSFSIKFSNVLLHLCERSSTEEVAAAIATHCRKSVSEVE